jgi:hypothetical protein
MTPLPRRDQSHSILPHGLVGRRPRLDNYTESRHGYTGAIEFVIPWCSSQLVIGYLKCPVRPWWLGPDRPANIEFGYQPPLLKGGDRTRMVTSKKTSLPT